MSAEPLVSVVMPTYNQADYLREAMESVAAQSHANWELIVINNYSEDHTVDVVRGFAHPNVELIDFRNQGVIAASRNLGIRTARGEWIAFLDSDDTWLPGKIEQCLARADGGADVIGHALDLMRNGRHVRTHRSGPETRAGFKSLVMRGPCMTPSALMARKSVLDGVGGFSEDPEFRTAEDYELWLKLAFGGARFVFMDQPLTRYRVHDHQASGSAKVHLDATMAVVKKHYALFESHSLGDRLRMRWRIASLFHGAARNYHREGDRRRATKYLLKSLFQSPFYYKSYIDAVIRFHRLEH